MKISCTLYTLQQTIKEHMGGSIEGIRICIGRYIDDQAYTDPKLRLKDIGIATDGKFYIYYDYGVIPRPLLTTPIIEKKIYAEESQSAAAYQWPQMAVEVPFKFLKR